MTYLVDLALEELARQKMEPALDLFQGSFAEQSAFIKDQAKLKAAFCTRRAAKSYTAGLYMVKEALEHPGVKCLYIALTRQSAYDILWADVLKAINRSFKLGMDFHETRLEARLSNGSTIRLLGVDVDEEEKNKLLGQKYKLVIIDESASFTVDLRELVYKILKPAVADYRGTICMVGTPGNLTKGLFYDITTGVEAGWSLHQWDTFANPYMARNWQDEIDELTRINPQVVETPWFRQMYLGQWVVDQDALIYKFNPQRNIYDQLPASDGYRYILGSDLGYENDSAFVVLGYQPADPNLYIIESQKQKHMDLTDFANRVKQLDKIYRFDVCVVDGAVKQAVMELNNRQGLRLIPADKTGKMDFIEVVMNTQLITGRLLAHRTKASSLTDEWLGLIRDPRSTKRQEHPNCANHAADAALYGARYCYSHLFEPIATEAKPKVGSLQWAEEEAKRMEERTIAEVERERQMREDPMWVDLEDAGGW